MVGLLINALIQRQVRLYLQNQHLHLPGSKGLTSTPTAVVVLVLFTPVMLVQWLMETAMVQHIYGVQAYHLLVCDALGLDRV